MKKWIQTTTFLMAALWLVSCSPKISKIEYEKQAYEMAQLEKRLELLQKEQEKSQFYAENTTKGASYTAQTDFNKLKAKHILLQQQYEALQKAYKRLKVKKTETTEVQNISTLEYNELKEKYDRLQSEYVALEAQHNYMVANMNAPKAVKKVKKSKAKKKTKRAKKPKTKKRETVKKTPVKMPEVVKVENTEKTAVSSTETDPIPVVMEEEEGMSKQEWTRAEQTSNVEANVSQLYFNYKDFERREDRLIMEVRIANRGNKRKMKWAAQNIQLVDKSGRIFEAKDYRVGKTYASRVTGNLTKRLKKDYTVQAVFAFEGVPLNLIDIKALRLIIDLDGENTLVEFRDIELETLTRSYKIEF